MSPRAQLTLVVLGCAAGAVLALVAAARPWAVEIAVRPPPLPDLRTTRSGGDLHPWLPALAWVGLAGAGALLATRGAVRRLVGGLLVVAGAGLALGAAPDLSGAEPSPVWPVLTGLGGVAVALAGGAAVLLARHWPAMSARYDRAAGGGTGAPTRTEGGPVGGSEPAPVRPAERPDALWDALDRGVDPTDR